MDMDVSLFPRVLYHLALQDVRNLLSHVRFDESGEVAVRLLRELREGREPSFEGGISFRF